MKKTDLQTLFGFTEADLEANRAHLLTDRQARRLLRRNARNSGFIAFGVVLALGVLYFATGISPIALVLVALVAVIWQAFLMYMARHYGLRGQNSEPIHIEHLSGRIDLKIGRGDNPAYTLTMEGIPGRKFRITKDQLLALHRGEHYHVYAMPFLSQIVAIEHFSPLDMDDLAAEELSAEAEKPKNQEFFLGDDGEIFSSELEATSQQANQSR